MSGGAARGYASDRRNAVSGILYVLLRLSWAQQGIKTPPRGPPASPLTPSHLILHLHFPLRTLPLPTHALVPVSTHPNTYPHRSTHFPLQPMPFHSSLNTLYTSLLTCHPCLYTAFSLPAGTSKNLHPHLLVPKPSTNASDFFPITFFHNLHKYSVTHR